MKDYIENLFDKRQYKNIKKHKKSEILIQLINNLTNEQVKFLKENKLIDDIKDFKEYIYNTLSLSICQNKVSLDEDIIFYLWNIKFQKFLKNKKISIPYYKVHLDYLPNIAKFVMYQLYKDASLESLKKFIEDTKIDSFIDINLINNNKINNKKFQLIFSLLFFYSLNYLQTRKIKREELKKYYKYKRIENVKSIVEKTKKDFFKNIHYIILKHQAYIISGEKGLEEIFGIRKKPTKLNKFIPFKKEKLKEGELFKDLQEELQNFQTNLNKNLKKYKIEETKKDFLKKAELITIGEIIASLTALIDGGIFLLILNGMAFLYVVATKDNKKCKLLEELQQIETDIKREINE